MKKRSFFDWLFRRPTLPPPHPLAIWVNGRWLVPHPEDLARAKPGSAVRMI